MDSRFLRPDTDTLTLANGDTLTVKRRLTAGDSRVMKGMQAIPTLVELGLVLAYLLDWSLVGLDGAKVPIADLAQADFVRTLDALDDESFDEIHAAIQAHVAAMAAERAEEKKRKARMRGDAPISPSPFVVVGASSGSVA